LHLRTVGLWFIRIVGGLVVVLALGLAVLGIRVNGQLARKHAVADLSLTVPGDTAAISRGQHLSVLFNCQGCHGSDMAGQPILDAPLVGRIYAPNLTSAGVTSSFTASDWNRAVRHGVGRGGRALVIMPSDLFSRLSDADLGAIITYARSQPPIVEASPPCELGPLGWVLATMTPGGVIAAEHIDHSAGHAAVAPIGVTAEYGGYLANACVGCHGPQFSGGRSGEPGAPPAPNLTPAPDGHLANWTEEQFVRALRTGVTPEGKALSGYMPWPNFSHMTDDELAALWMYLHGLPPRTSTAPRAR
jgi:mono/diheme cytochrome c family protein